jgi:protein-tyrosine phosphatase
VPRILFICTANQFRSPIAAAYFLRKLLLMGTAGDWKVGSAGTWAVEGLPAHPTAIASAARIGLDLGRHRTREVTEKLINAADLIVCMQPGQKESLEAEFSAIRGRVILLGSLANLPGDEIPDPAKESFSQPDNTAQMIYNCIDEGFNKILQLVNISNNDQGNI